MNNYRDSYVTPKKRVSDINGKFVSGVTYAKRVKLEKYLKEGMTIKSIARSLDLTRGTIWYERNRCAGEYNADEAQKTVGKGSEGNHKKSTNLNPTVHSKLKKIKEYIIDCLQENNNKNIKKKLSYCKYLLETLGFGEGNLKTGLTDEQKKEIMRLRNEGKSLSEIAVVMERSKSVIHRLTKKLQGKKDAESIKRKWLQQ